LLPEIATEVHKLYTIIGGRMPSHPIRSPVLTAVIDNDDLMLVIDVREYFRQSSEQVRHHILLVVHRNYDRNEHDEILSSLVAGS
jgi:hypothetical protein